MTTSEQHAEYAAARTLAHSVTDSVSPEQRSAIEAAVLRRVAEEGPLHFARTHRQPQFRGMNVVSPDWLRAEADRIEEEAR